MADHKLNPKEGETWFHPLTLNTYRIHSVTDDGWVRYQSVNAHTNKVIAFTALWTQPTLKFITKYQKQVNPNE